MADYPTSEIVPWDEALKLFIDQNPGGNGFLFDPLHPDFGGVDDLATDNTDAVLAARDAARAVGGIVFCRRPLLISETFVLDDAFGIRGLGGNTGLVASPDMPADAPTLWVAKTDDSVAVTQGHIYGWSVQDIRVDGNGRSVDCSGVRFDYVTAGNVRNLDIRHFAQENLILGNSVRETNFFDVHCRGGGDLATGHAAVDVSQGDSGDAHNNVHFYGFKSIYPFGIGLNMMPTDETSPQRGITFHGPMIHGFTPDTPVTDEGVTLTPDWRCVGAPLVQIADVQTLSLISPRVHRSGYGQPLVLVRDNPASGSTKNTATLGDGMWGLPQHQTGNFTADASTDQCTFTGGQLGTGAMIRFTTTTTLPAGLSLLTDYYAIRVDNDTFKVATSRANAEAGTAVNITSAGTGTHTVTTQDFFVLVEHSSGQTDVIVRGGRATEDSTNVRAAVCNKNADGTVVVSQFSPASTLAKVYEPFSSTDSPQVPTVHVVKKVDETRPNNSTAIDAELLLNLTPGKWAIKGVLYVDGNATPNGDFNVQWFSSQTGWTGKVLFGGQAISATVNVGSQFNQIAGRGTTVGRGMIGVDTGDLSKVLGITVTGTVTVDVAGQFQIRWAQNSTDGTNLTTLHADSWIEATPLS